MTPPLKRTCVGHASPVDPRLIAGPVPPASVWRAQESREMARDGGIGGVRQPHLLQADTALPRRHVVAGHDWKEAVEQRLVHVFDGERRGDGAADQPGAAAEQRDRTLPFGRVAQQRLLREARLVPEPVQLPGVDAVSGTLEPRLQQAGERQIHVVAAEQDVLADGHPFEAQVAIALGHRDQAEVVVPPPTSHTRTRSPTVTRRRQPSPRASSHA